MDEILESAALIFEIVVLAIAGLCVLFVIVLNILEYRADPKMTFWQAVKKTWQDIIYLLGD